MARKAAPPKKWRRRWGAWAALALAVMLAAFVGWTALCARTVHVRRAEVALSDLPASMDGTTLLFLSDFSLCGTNTPAQAAKLVQRLQSLHPDALLLNGDFSAPSLMDRLNGRTVKRLCVDQGVSPADREMRPVLRVNGRAAAVPELGLDENFAPDRHETAARVIFYKDRGENV